MGLAIAEHLAKITNMNLVLTGRSEFPERQHWVDWQKEHAENDPVSVKIRKLLSLEALGAKVMVIRADVASREDMRRVKVLVERDFGRIQGVIHAAGLAGGGMAQVKTAESVERVMAAKSGVPLSWENVLRRRILTFWCYVRPSAELREILVRWIIVRPVRFWIPLPGPGGVPVGGRFRWIGRHGEKSAWLWMLETWKDWPMCRLKIWRWDSVLQRVWMFLTACWGLTIRRS
jgi:hypothetical protein